MVNVSVVFNASAPIGSRNNLFVCLHDPIKASMQMAIAAGLINSRRELLISRSIYIIKFLVIIYTLYIGLPH